MKNNDNKINGDIRRKFNEPKKKLSVDEITQHLSADRIEAETVNIINNVEKLDQTTSKEPKQSHWARKKKVVIASISLILLVIVSVGLYAGFRHGKYNSFMDEAEALVQSGNYNDASRMYHKASNYALTKSNYVKSTCLEANIYLMQYMLWISGASNEEPEQADRYLKTATSMFNYILSRKEYKGVEFYYDAAAGLSNCYYFTNASLKKNEWKNAVQIMDEWVNSLDLATTPAEYIPQLTSVYCSLALYYDRMVTSSEANLRDPSITKKASDYAIMSLQLYSADGNANGIVDYDQIAYMIARISKNIGYYALSTDDPNGYFESLIKDAENVITEIKESGTQVSPSVIFDLKYTIGRIQSFQFFLSQSLDEKNREKYRNEAYQTLSGLLSFSYDDAGGFLNNAGVYCVYTCLCSDDDIDQILKNYETGLNAVFSKGKYTEDYKKLTRQVLSSCAFITFCYTDHSKAAYELGEKVSASMIKDRSYLTEDELEYATEFHDYFTGKLDIENSTNVKSEKMHYDMLKD